MTLEEKQEVQQMIDTAVNRAVKDQEHNGSDSKRLSGKNLAGAPRAAISDVSGTADGTYSANEQNLINAQTVAVNEVISVLRYLGFIRE